MSWLRNLTAFFLCVAAALAQHTVPTSPACGPASVRDGDVTAPCVDAPSPAQPATAEESAVPYRKNSLPFPSEAPALSQAGKTDPPDVTIKSAVRSLPRDQLTIWTSPFKARIQDLTWLVPLMVTSGVLIGSDQQSLAREHSNATAVRRSTTISNAGLALMLGLPAVTYVSSLLNGSRREHETGILAGEAVVDSLIVDEALNVLTARARPTLTGGDGRFFTSSRFNSSFPSAHSTLSWAAASVFAHEYPGWLSQLVVYGGATAVSLSRVTARQHFPSDVLVGSVTGWLTGRQIYNAHHNRELDNIQYGNFIPEAPLTGTTYVSIDSWVYPSLDRLTAMGYIDTAVAGLRPWTRSECARLVQEAGQEIDPGGSGTESDLYARLASEFQMEIEGKQTQPDARIEEIYARVGFLSGTPLADDYHFAKTFTDDFGRPFGSGANAVAGVSGRAVVGPLAFYVRGEYQHAGTLPVQGAAAQQAIISLEGLPFAPPQRTDSLDRLRFLEAYASFTFHNNVISIGKQTLWWGPGADGPFLASNNAEPLPLLRISRASPLVLPSVFRLFGPIRAEMFFGQLGGQQFVALFDATGKRKVVSAPLHPHPFVQGLKFSFKPTRNVEFGFGVTGILSGPGFPLTLRSLLRTYSPSGNTVPGAANDPGDRRSAFDFSYRVPRLRNWLTFYGDSFTEDEYTPVSFPRKSSFRAGLYLPRLPKLLKVELRAEGVYTDIPSLGSTGVAYFNGHYLSGYTNYGQIIGNAIGREGRGVNVWATYHFTSTNTVQLHYRTQHVNPEFLQGGYLRDFDLTGSIVQRRSLVLTVVAKYEHWNFPLLAATPKTNVSAGLQLSFRPLQGWSLWGHK